MRSSTPTLGIGGGRLHQRVDRRVGRPGHDRPQERRSGRLATPLHDGFEEGPIDVLGIDVATLVVAEVSGEEGESATGSATGKRLIGDDHEPVDVAVGEAIPLGQRPGRHHCEHLIVDGGGLGPTLDGVSMMLLHGPSQSTRSWQAVPPHREPPQRWLIAQRSPGDVYCARRRRRRVNRM